MPTLEENLNKIIRFRTLKPDWNGNHAVSFSSDLLDHVCDVLRDLDYQPEVFPVADGSVQLEYHRHFNDLEIQMYDSYASVYKNVHDREFEFETGNDAASLNKIIRTFMLIA